MITDADVKKLKESFKDAFATKDDLKKSLRPLNKKLGTIINYFDRYISWHTRRLKELEKKVGIETP